MNVHHMTAVVHRKDVGFSPKIMMGVACSAELARRLAMPLRRDPTLTTSSVTAGVGWCGPQNKV